MEKAFFFINWPNSINNEQEKYKNTREELAAKDRKPKINNLLINIVNAIVLSQSQIQT